MGLRMQPARIPGSVELINHYPAKSGETGIVVGSVVVLDANGEVTLCGADPQSILGVAMNAYNKGPGYDAADSPVKLNYPAVGNIAVALADSRTVFSAKGINGSTIQSPTQTQVDTQFGLVNSSGVWYVDIGETSTVSVEIVDIDDDNDLYFFKFLAAVRQLPV